MKRLIIKYLSRLNPRYFLEKGFKVLARHPTLKRYLRTKLYLFPKVEERIRNLLKGRSMHQSKIRVSLLSPSAQLIYKQLSREFNIYQKQKVQP